MKNIDRNQHAGFTLIEILAAIGIVTVLSVVVILSLNPPELLKQSRDGTRISDLATIDGAVGLYSSDVAGSLGVVSTTYVSIPDPSATSTAGDQCQGLGLPSLPLGWSYHCAASSTYKKTDGTGWIPVNFQAASYGSTLSKLPVDPINVSSSRLYYTYTTDGTKYYEDTGVMESNKYKLGGSGDVVSKDGGVLASVYEKGSTIGLEPLDYGDSSLVGYWTFDEGSSSTAYDYSGKNATGTLVNTPTRTNGKINRALTFNGSNQYITIGNPTSLQLTGNISMCAWAYPQGTSLFILSKDLGGNPYDYGFYIGSDKSLNLFYGANQSIGNASALVTLNMWNHACVVVNNSVATFYLNGVSYAGGAATITNHNKNLDIGDGDGGAFRFSGSLDDIRIYNRVLSLSEIQAMYNYGK